MDNNGIYEIAKEKAFNKIKHIRNAYAVRPEEADPVTTAAMESRVFYVGGHEFDHYSFIIEEAKHYTFDMLSKIIIGLLGRYNIDYAPFDFRLYGVNQFPVFAFIQKTESGNNLYIIREYGMNHRIGDELLNYIANQKRLNYCYVSLVEKNAFSEDFRHNNDETDPARGTGIISLPFFLQYLFGEEERKRFMDFAIQYTNEVRAYLGLSVTKTLTPNAQFSFRRSADYELLKFDYKGKYQELIRTDKYQKTLEEVRKEDAKKSSKNPRYVGKSESPISDAQWSVINEQFIEKAFYKAVLGRRDFAQSFLTAEWLFDSMSKAGRIDYSPVAMGYFKSVEQLMWDILVLHKTEPISVKKKGAQEYLPINSPDITWDKNDDPDKLDTTIGALIGAFDFFKHRPRIFCQSVNDNTRDAIIIILRMFKNLRNGYTHKDNLTDWNFIILVRDAAYVVYSLLLGGCMVPQKEYPRLNIPAADHQTAYADLYDYINYHADQPYYLYDENGHCRVAIGKPDDGIEFDDFGIPKFSGAYFQALPNATDDSYVVTVEEIMSKSPNHKGVPGELFRLDENKMPLKIYNGVCYPVADGMKYSGPQRLIYENGVFIDPGLSSKPEY